MGAERTTAARMRSLQLTLSAAWTSAWVIGVGVLVAVASNQSDQLQAHDLDAQLAFYATTTYGLAWFDAAGEFHDEIIRNEGDLFDGTVDIWVLEPGQPPQIHLGPSDPIFQVDSLGVIAQQVLEAETNIVLAGSDAQGRIYRLYAVPTYQDGADDDAKAAIIVVGDPRPALRAHASFTTKLALIALGVGLAGLAVGIALARWSIRPLASALEERERFLVAAAHELRTPIATLRAVAESALAGDEAPEAGLQRVSALAKHTSDVVDELLLFARLDAGGAVLERQSVRLDLLVETCIPEDAEIELLAEECIAEVDPRLVRVAARNLIENAIRHSNSPTTKIRVTVCESSITVEDDGPGIPDQILEIVQGPFSVAPSFRGAGIGLATTQMIAKLHGGELQLENRPEGGAQARLRLG
jgi:signal transduction histidine kinase